MRRTLETPNGPALHMDQMRLAAGPALLKLQLQIERALSLPHWAIVASVLWSATDHSVRARSIKPAGSLLRAGSCCPTTLLFDARTPRNTRRLTSHPLARISRILSVISHPYQQQCLPRRLPPPPRRPLAPLPPMPPTLVRCAAVPTPPRRRTPVAIALSQSPIHANRVSQIW